MELSLIHSHEVLIKIPESLSEHEDEEEDKSYLINVTDTNQNQFLNTSGS